MLRSRFFKLEHAIILLILLVGFYIRILPLRNLGGHLTGLDPYLFLRYANWIEKYGYLPDTDFYKYFPISHDIRTTMWLLAFTIRFFGILFGSNYVGAIFYSPIMFFLGSFVLALALTELWGKKEGILFALIISVLPGFVFRVSSGFSDKEPLAYLFMSLSIYFAVRYFKRKEDWCAFYSGLFQGLMALAWGGFQFLLAMYSLTFLFFIWRDDVRKFLYIFSIPFLFCIVFLTRRYGVIPMMTASYYGILFSAALLSSILYDVMKRIGIKIEYDIYGIKIREEHISILLVGILGLFLLWGKIWRIIDYVFITPYGGNRFALSVAENQPPYFRDWLNSLSHLFVLLLLLLPIYIYRTLKDEKLSIVLWLSFLFLILSRYSPRTHDINKAFSKIYWIPMVLSISLIPLIRREAEFMEVAFLNLLLLAGIGSRSAIRILFVFCIPFSIVLSRSLTLLYEILERFEFKIAKYVPYAIFFFLIIKSYQLASLQAKMIYPTVSPIWVQTYDWIKNNTTPYDIISHWWDYGYWTQFYGDRFTSVDGGNSYYVRNFYNARYFFTGENAKDFLKAMEVLGLPDYILITSREPFVFYQIARIGYRDTWLGVYYLARSGEEGLYYHPMSVAPLHYDLISRGYIFPGNRSYIQGIVVGKNLTGFFGIVGFPEGGYAGLFNISCVCVGGKCVRMEGELKGCLVFYGEFAIYVPEKCLNYTFIKTYIMDGDLPWMRKVYDNKILIFNRSIEELNLINLRNERIPDLKVYKVDYRKLAEVLGHAH